MILRRSVDQFKANQSRLPAIGRSARQGARSVQPVLPNRVGAKDGLASQTASASRPLPTTLGGISVQIEDSVGSAQLAPLFAISPGEANILVPADVAVGPAAATVLNGSAAALTGSTTITTSAPALTAWTWTARA